MEDLKKMVVWLCSSQDEELKNLISDIATHVKSVPFSPHITLLGSIEMKDTKKHKESLQNIMNHIPPIQIKLKGIGKENIFWRSFYYHAHPFKELNAMHQKMANGLKAFGAEIDHKFMPHLSLLYSNSSEEEKNKLEIEFQQRLEQREFIFDTIQWVHFIPKDINAWKIVHSYRLS